MRMNDNLHDTHLQLNPLPLLSCFLFLLLLPLQFKQTPLLQLSQPLRLSNSTSTLVLLPLSSGSLFFLRGKVMVLEVMMANKN